MKRSTAVRHLRELADQASDFSARFATMEHAGFTLSELWIGGDLLDDVDQVEDGVIVLRLDVPEDELPWLSLHAEGERWVSMLRLDKRPLRHQYRPASRPAWDHELRRVLRFWSAQDGPEVTAIDAVSTRSFEDVAPFEPTAAEVHDLLVRELPRSERHLREVLDNYWEPGWQRQHRGDGHYPEDHLWRAAEAVESMRRALTGLH